MMTFSEALIDDVHGEEVLEYQEPDGSWGTTGVLAELFDTPRQFLRLLPEIVTQGKWRLVDDETGMIIPLN